MNLKFFDFLVNESPNEKFNTQGYTRRGILPEVIEKYPEGINGEKWNMKWLSKNIILNLDFLETYVDGVCGDPWDVNELSGNKSLNLKFVEDHINGICGQNWNLYLLAFNDLVTEEFIEKYIDGINNIKWDISSLVHNRNISFDFLIRHPNGLYRNKWLAFRYYINFYTHFNLEIEYEKYTQFFCKYTEWIKLLMESANISSEFVEQHLNGINGIKWNMGILSGSKNISMKFIKKYIDGINGEKWDLGALSINASLTQDFLEEYPNGFNGQQWDVKYLSGNPVIDDAFVEKHIFGFCGQRWNKKWLLRNDSISDDFFIKYSNYKRACDNNPKLLENNNLSFIENIKVLTNWKNLYCDDAIYRLPSWLNNPNVTEEILQKDFLNITPINSVIGNITLSMNIFSRYPNGIFGQSWENHVYSHICSVDYIWMHPKGYDNGKNIIPWNISILANKDWSKLPSSLVKSAHKN